MPGILPMKVIRVGGNAQSRIAQACDRCRSKKIRCDGVRPCCTQCSNVGFECKTSDKLSRRAFPRGYTESLEDRVRQLESEVRELKDLLDEKDEKIDMLSRLQSFSPISRKNSRSLSPSVANELKSEGRADSEEVIEVTAPTTHGPTAPATSSSTSTFVEAFKCKASVHGRSAVGIKTSNLQPIMRPSSESTSPKTGIKAPPRLLSDQYINIFLQEWAPLFPFLHRSGVLKTYQEFLQDPESSQWRNRKHDLALLFLIFDLAAASTKSPSEQSRTSYEHEWRRAMQAMTTTPSLVILQCHILAQLVYLLKSDQKHFLRHRASAVTLCHQMGLHLSQDQLPHGASGREMRKRVFWAQYIVDRFGASSFGVPMLLREKDITTEYPADIDDEIITGSASQNNSAGETKMSNTLALISASRILTKVLEDIHPQAVKYDLPLKKIRSLTDEIDRWNERLPDHLRLKFVNGKPSTGIVSDRSPLLALAEFYVRLLISRPIMCFASGNSASAAVLASANSAKHIAQICDLLDERSMNYAFPLCKIDLLVGSGLTLLWQALELAPNSKLVKDNQKSITLVSQLLTKESENVGAEFTRIVKNLGLSSQVSPSTSQAKMGGTGSPTPNSMAAPDKFSTRSYLQAIASRFSSSTFGAKLKAEDARRRETRPSISPAQLGQYGRNFSQLSISSARSEPAYPGLSPTTSNDSTNSQGPVNLDYYPLGNESVPNLSSLPLKDQIDLATWEQMLTRMDSGDDNIFTGVYGGLPGSEAFSAQSVDGQMQIPTIDQSNLSLPTSSATMTPHPLMKYDDATLWSQDPLFWQSSFGSGTLDLQDINHLHSNQSTSVPPQSVVSYTSEDSSAQSCGASTDDYVSLTSAMSNSNYSTTPATRSGSESATFDDSNLRRKSSLSGQSQHVLPLLDESQTSTRRSNSFERRPNTHASDYNHVDPDASNTYGGIVMPNLVDGTNGWS